MMGFCRRFIDVRHKNASTRSSLRHQHENELMKSSWVQSVLVILAICLLPAHCVLAEDERMNEYSTVHNRKLLQTRPCIIRRLVDYQMLAEEDEGLWVCELQGEDCALAGFEVDSKITVELVGIDSSVLEANHVISGVTTLHAPGATIMNGRLYIRPRSNVVFGELLENQNNKGGRKLKTADLASGGVSRTVIAVRIIASDAATASSVTEISDNIFGTDGDIVNLKTRYAACSYGEITIEPFIGISTSGVEISNGVVEVNIPNIATDINRMTIHNAALSALTALVGEIRFQFDHIMLCLPPGTTRDGGVWQAFTAGGISSITTYNDVWCNSVSAQMHEIGHNLGLDHSNDGTAPTGDTTCLMGYSYKQDEGPLRCYNPAKSWQLGWYGPRRAMVGFDSTNLWAGKLVGIADYDPDAVDTTVHLQVENGDNDYYIGFNRKTGINSGTGEAQDLVQIVTQGSGYSPSDLVAILGVGDEYQIFNVYDSRESLIVRVNGIVVGAGDRWYADVEVYNPAIGQAPPSNSGETGVPSTSPSSPPSPAPSTSAPSPAPSFQPSPAPSTTAPSKAPSLHPSATPSTSAPSKLPSLYPSTSPSTSYPSTKPSSQPSTVPSSTPSARPSSVISASDPSTSAEPTPAPATTSSPSASAHPSPSPSSTPSSKPSLVPSMTTSPSSSPSAQPSSAPTTSAPSVSHSPSAVPSTSAMPSTSVQPSSAPSLANGSVQPSSAPSLANGSVQPSSVTSASLPTAPKLLLPLLALLLTCLFL